MRLHSLRLKLDAEILDRVRAYAQRQEVSLPVAVARLLTIALDHLTARASGGQAAAAALSREERRDRAIRAATARWQR